jgi:dihydroorotate dehydrogenase
MGLYRAVARPLFSSLPPEAAHRLAQSILSLPLPWERIGGTPTDPALRTSLAGIKLSNPVGLAAGFDKSCSHLAVLGRLGFGYVIGGTITHDPRAGNPKPRIARYPRRGSMTNAMGLPNPGAEAAARTLSRTPRPGPRLASIADQGPDEVIVTHGLLEAHVDGVELNVSCPNVSWGRDRDNEGHLALLMRELDSRRTKPLFVKLPPFRSDVEREAVLALAHIAQEGGADGLTCSNTRPVSDRHLSVGAGGLSGRELLPDTVRIVGDVRTTTGGALPINACGGVFSAADALACLEAGATTVQVYTGLIEGGPRVVRDIVRGLSEALNSRSLAPATSPGQDGTRPGTFRRRFGATASAGERRPDPAEGPGGRPAPGGSQALR